MHSNYPCSLWYVLECCCYCTFFKVQYFVIAIVVWTSLTIFFLGGCSKYYVVTSCVCSCFVCYFDSRSAYFNVCDNWSVRCDCGYNKWICARACLKNHSRNLHAPLCGIFHPNSVAVAQMVLLVFGQCFVLYKHFANYVLRIFSDMPLIFFAQFIRIDRLTVFYYNFCRRYLREVCLENVG